jgi:hypothetical protein
MNQQQDANSPSGGAFTKMAIFRIASVRSLDFIKTKSMVYTAAKTGRKHKAKHLISSQANACCIIIDLNLTPYSRDNWRKERITNRIIYNQASGPLLLFSMHF